MNVAEPLLKQAEARGGAVAIIQPTKRGDRTITFAEIAEQSAALSGWFERKGLGPGDRVLVMIGISIELYLAMSALLRAGLVAEFLDPSAGREHVRRCCEVAPPKALLGSAKAQLLRVAYGGLWRVKSLVYPRVIGGDVSGASVEALAECTADSPALLTFTSGSTALPKAAVRTHGLLAAQQAALVEAIDMEPGQVDLATLPIFVLANMAAGVTTVLADADLKRPGFIEPGPVVEQIRKHKVTRSTASPAFYERLAEHCEQTGGTLAPLERVYTGGAPVFHDLLERLDLLMPSGGPVILYGSTEAEPIAHVGYGGFKPDDVEAIAGGKGLLVGQPVRQVELRVADPLRLEAGEMTAEQFDAAKCGVDEPGEILVTGEHVLKGYLNPEDDSETKLRVGGTVWHRSGDMGRLDAAGRLWLLGRTSAVIRDERGTVYPFAIECEARQVKGVKLAAVLEHHGRTLVIQPELDDDGEDLVETDEVLAALETRFAGVIDDIVVDNAIPLDARHNAKVLYPELRRSLNVPSFGKHK